MMNSKNNFIGPVNLGNPNEISINELASLVIKLTKSNSKVIYLPMPQDDPLRRQPDINLADKELDWSPIVDLPEGLLKTIDYFKSIT